MSVKALPSLLLKITCGQRAQNDRTLMDPQTALVAPRAASKRLVGGTTCLGAGLRHRRFAAANPERGQYLDRGLAITAGSSLQAHQLAATP